MSKTSVSVLVAALAIVSATGAAAAQISPLPLWPADARTAPVVAPAADAADGAGFQVVDQLGHQDSFWQNTLAGDADHDGRQEIVLRDMPVDGGANSIVFYEDDGSGQFDRVFSFLLEDGGLLAMGDVDGDGLTDLFLERGLASGHEFFRLESSSPGGFPDHEVWKTVKQGSTLDYRATIADVDGDGLGEFITTDNLGRLEVFETVGTANDLKSILHPTLGGALGNPVVADFDQDGRPEIAVADFSFQSLLLLEATGNDAIQLQSVTSHPLVNAYQLAVINRPSPDGRPMLFLAGQIGDADYHVLVYEALGGSGLTLLNDVQVPASCGVSVAEIYAADVVGSRVPEIIVSRLCGPVPVYEVGPNGVMTLFDAPNIADSAEIVATTRTASHSGALAVGTFPSGANPQGSTFVLELP